MTSSGPTRQPRSMTQCAVHKLPKHDSGHAEQEAEGSAVGCGLGACGGRAKDAPGEAPQPVAHRVQGVSTCLEKGKPCRQEPSSKDCTGNLACLGKRCLSPSMPVLCMGEPKGRKCRKQKGQCMQCVLLGSLITILLLSGSASAVEDGKWQEAEASIDPKAATCSERDKHQRMTERVSGCTQSACKQAQRLAAQTLGIHVSHRCKGAIRVGGCQKGPGC